MCNTLFAKERKDGQRWRPKERFHVDFALLLAEAKGFRKMLEVFHFALLFRMAGNCWVIKLKRFVGYRSRLYWQGTVSLVASCCRF